MSVYLVVNNSDGIVSNAIEWDGGASLDIPNVSIIPLPNEPQGVWIGWTYINGVWTEPPEPPEIVEETTEE